MFTEGNLPLPTCVGCHDANGMEGLINRSIVIRLLKSGNLGSKTPAEFVATTKETAAFCEGITASFEVKSAEGSVQLKTSFKE